MSGNWKWGVQIGVLLGVLLGIVGCGLDGPQSTLRPEGPVASLQAGVFSVTLVVCLGIFLATGGLLVYAVWRFRARAGETARVVPQTHGNPLIEFALIGLVVILLLIIAVPNLQALFATSAPPVDEKVLHVNVVGYQWWWAFEYPELGVVTANELHVPVGRVVLAHLRTRDVIHSFWIPRLAGKVDLIPNRANRMWFKADAPGVFFGQCAEFCGASHAHMRFRVVAESDAAFEAWVQAQRQPAHPPGTTLAQQGSQLFVQKGCMACHAIAGTPAQGAAGPDLTHLASRQSLAAGVLPNTPDSLARWLKDPQDVKPNSRMPNLGLTDTEIAALVAYLQGLK